MPSGETLECLKHYVPTLDQFEATDKQYFLEIGPLRIHRRDWYGLRNTWVGTSGNPHRCLVCSNTSQDGAVMAAAWRSLLGLADLASSLVVPFVS